MPIISRKQHGYSLKMTSFSYLGNELDLFACANRWKSYWSSRFNDFMGESVLEVGAGIGTNTIMLCKGNFRQWICIEPDSKLAQKLSLNIKSHACRSTCKVINGTLHDISANVFFDTILYIDVLEHIEDDKAEIAIASKHLNKNGKIIILAPAHSWLFSRFDKNIGHYRRYNKHSLNTLAPKNLKLLKMEYLDSIGLILSLFNRILLKNPTPSINQIRTWDTFIIPLSLFFDKVFNYNIGKSILGIWRYRGE